MIQICLLVSVHLTKTTYCCDCGLPSFSSSFFDSFSELQTSNFFLPLDENSSNDPSFIDSFENSTTSGTYSSERALTSTPRKTRKRRFPRVKVLTINCRSLRSEYKRCEFASIIDFDQPDIINATETHLNNEFCSAELNLPGYEIFRRDRNNGSPGGGVLIAVKNTLLATREPALEEDSIM